jgi:hypothetical protein
MTDLAKKSLPAVSAAHANPACRCSDFRLHKWIIYLLLAASYCLHLSVVVDKLNGSVL